MITSIVTAVFVLAVLIVVHELGHFLAAKRLGVGVIRFSLGFGPVLFSRTIGGTEYALSAIPLGGYVKMIGEEEDGIQGGEAPPPTGDAVTAPGKLRDDSLLVKPLWVRAVVAVGGPAFNLLFAWLLYSMLVATGIPVPASVVGVAEGMPAEQAGMVSGDDITSVDGKPIRTWEELAHAIRGGSGDPVELGFRRDGEEQLLTVQPARIDGQSMFGEPETFWGIGVTQTNSFVTERSNPLEAVGRGFELTVSEVKKIFLVIAKLFQGVVPLSTLGGPIMIGMVAGDIVHAGMIQLLLFMAVLSINLGVLNLLPIPVLDGGQLMFIGLEALMGRPLAGRQREAAQLVGLFLLLGLMIFVVFNDISRLVSRSFG